MASTQAASWLPAIPERDFAGRDGYRAFTLAHPQPQRLPPVSELARPARLGILPGVYAPLSTHERGMEPLPSYGDPHAAFVQTAAVHAQSEMSPDAYTGQPPYAGSSDIASYASQGYATQSYPQPQYRAHASSVLAGGYGLSPTAMYAHPQYSNSVSSLASSAGSHSPYDSNASSSFANIKSSPLSQNDGAYAYHTSDAVSRAGAYGQHALDRRPSTLSLASSFSSGFQDNYSPLGFDGQQQYYEHSEAYTAGSHSSQTTPEVVAETVQATLPQSSQMEMAPNYDGYNHAAEAPYAPSIDSMLADVRFQRSPDIRDLETFMRPFLDEYTRTPNRLAFGERTVIVMTSKVAQKSYGTEKRFLCPPPSALLIGNSWWSDPALGDSKLRPPRVTIAIPGESTPPETNVEWSDANGKPFNLYDPPTGTTYMGRGTGTKMYISDADERRKKIEAVVTVMAPASEGVPDQVIGEFASRPIKVISKPSKKRQSAKNLELCINHGTTVSLFHRLRSQTVSTRYLCVSSSTSAIKGSDGNPLVGLDAQTRAATPSFVAKTTAWDAFVLYIVDVKKETSSKDPPPPPPQSDFPSPPPNAIPYTNNGSPIPVYYNQTVVLQCLTSGVVSPVLIIRKVDHSTVALGGAGSESGRNPNDAYCALGEVCGDPVSQLHKVAFEVYDPQAVTPAAGSPGNSGAFLSCSGEKVNTHRPIDGRRWAPHASDSPIMPPSSPLAPSSSYGSIVDYFGGVRLGGSTPSSPVAAEFAFASNDGGRVKKKRSASSANGGLKNNGRGSRRRPQSAGSGGSGFHDTGDALHSSPMAHWQVEIGETSVWTIVGVDQVRYNFWIPPVLFNEQLGSSGRLAPVPSTPVTPFPGVLRYLRADRAAEVVRHHPQTATAPHPDAHKMLTLYGENFSRAAPPRVFFGAEPSPFVEVRCTEVVGCLPPKDDVPEHAERRPIILVRGDGVVYPSATMYP